MGINTKNLIRLSELMNEHIKREQSVEKLYIEFLTKYGFDIQPLTPKFLDSLSIEQRNDLATVFVSKK